MKKYFKIQLIFIGYLLTIPDSASANAGVPMIFLIMPAFGFSIIPIIFIEAFYLSKKLNLTGKVAGKTATISNLVSTVVGIPLTWLLLMAIQMVTVGVSSHGLDTAIGKVISVTWQAPWLIPYESELYWMIPAAGMFLLIPFFFVSWWSEYLVSRKMHRDIDKIIMRKRVREANLITYGLLTLWPITMLFYLGK